MTRAVLSKSHGNISLTRDHSYDITAGEDSVDFLTRDQNEQGIHMQLKKATDIVLSPVHVKFLLHPAHICIRYVA